ncbi:MAG: insulinase family protein [Gemmatimonadales bacterium]|nr:MAG: insulinase family protein [Gemmatimonadales bacterium]
MSSAVDRSIPPTPSPLQPFDLPVPDESRLDSGLEVRILRKGSVPLVSGCMVLSAGETGVPRDRAGLAVFTGDCLLGGTERRSGADLSEALEQLGTNLRVSAGWDATTLVFTCTAERLPDTLSVLAEVIREPAFPDDEVARVRRQRLAAIAQRASDPGDRADDAADRVLFSEDHPYARPLGGLLDSIPTLSAETARGWVEARYRPGSAGLVLVGDLDPDDAAAAVSREFEGWEGSALLSPELPPVSPPTPRPIVVADRPGAVQTELRVLYPAPPRAHEDHLALVVANSILGGAFTSRLNLRLREELGYTYGVHSRFVSRRPGGIFTVSTAVQTDVTAAAVEAAMAELERFVAEGPTEAETARARDYLAGVFPLRMETGAQLAARTAELLIYGLPSDEHSRYRERVRAVTRDDAAAAIRRHLDPARAPIVLCTDAGAVTPGLEALGLGPVEVVE